MEPEHDELPPEGARYKNRDWNPGAIPPDTRRDEVHPSSDADGPPPAGILVAITAKDFRSHWPELARYARLPADQVSEAKEIAALAEDLEHLVGDLERLKTHLTATPNELSAAPAVRLWALYSIPDTILQNIPADHQALLAELSSYIRSIITPEQWAGVEARDATLFERAQFSYLPYLLDRLPRLEHFVTAVVYGKNTLIDGFLELLDPKQKLTFSETTEDIQLRLVQVLKALELPDADKIFSVDLIEWLNLKSRGLVSEDNLSDTQLEALSDFPPFSDALERRPRPKSGLSVPIQLVEFQTNWARLSQHARVWKSSAAMIEDIEHDAEEDEHQIPFLSEEQRAQFTTAGNTYFTLHQIERMYRRDWQIFIGAEKWLQLRKEGLVFDDFLTEEVVGKLRSYDHFREIYDAKYNKPLIAQRQAEQQKKRRDEAEKARKEQKESKRKTYRILFLVGLIVGVVALTAYEYDRRSNFISTSGAASQTTQKPQSTAPQAIIQTPKVEQSPQQQIFIESREQTPVSPLGPDNQRSEANQPKNSLYWQGISKAAVSAFDGIGPVMEAASRGDDYYALASEIQRVKSLKYPLDGVFPLESRTAARKLNEDALAVFRDNPGYALSLQSRALATYANDTEIAGNLAHYLLLNELNEQALLTALYALAVPPGKLTTGSPANWQVLASAFARLDRTKNAEDALLVGLAITANLDGFCKSLLRHGTEFGPKVQSVVTTIFKKIKDRDSPGVFPSCTYPPTF